MDPDPDKHAVSPDLGLNCMQRLSAEDKKFHQQRKKIKPVTTKNKVFRETE